MSRCLDTFSTTQKWPKSWEKIEEPVVPLDRNLYGRPLARLLWKRQFEEALSERGWEKIPNWECMFVQLTRLVSVSICGWHEDCWKEAEFGSNVEDIDEKTWILTNLHHFLTTCIWDALSGHANQMRPSLNSTQKWSNHVFLLEQQSNYRDGKNLTHKP